MFSSKDKKVAQQDQSHITNTIGKGTTLEGDIEAYGNVRIEGRVKGNIKTKSKVALGKSSLVDGNILAQNAEIEGEIKGKIEIAEILILKPTAVVNGDIITNKLIVESGAMFNGSCQMGSAIKEIKLSDANGHTQQEETKVKSI